jgi:hypothetical protein
MVNLSVIKHYFVDEGQRSGRQLLTNLIVPGVGFLITLWLWTSLAPSALIVGVAWVLLGVIWLAVITGGFRRPTPELHGVD